MFTDLELITLCCIANEFNEDLHAFVGRNNEEAQVMAKINYKLEYHKDIVTDAEMLFNTDHNLFIFKGTDSKRDWFYNLDIRTKKMHHIKVHRGFYEQYAALKPFIVKNLNPELEHICFTGHSLGGAISTLAAFDYSYLKRNGTITQDCNSVSFASPRVGFKDLKKYFKEHNVDSCCYLQANDIIPLLPKFPFKHPDQKKILMYKDRFLFLDEKFNWEFLRYKLNIVGRFLTWYRTRISPWTFHDSEVYKASIAKGFTK